jgi:hypothetical protein
MHLLVGTKVVFCAISLYKLFSSGNYISNVGNIYIYIYIYIYVYVYICIFIFSLILVLHFLVKE